MLLPCWRYFDLVLLENCCSSICGCSWNQGWGIVVSGPPSPRTCTWAGWQCSENLLLLFLKQKEMVKAQWERQGAIGAWEQGCRVAGSQRRWGRLCCTCTGGSFSSIHCYTPRTPCDTKDRAPASWGGKSRGWCLEVQQDCGWVKMSKKNLSSAEEKILES